MPSPPRSSAVSVPDIVITDLGMPHVDGRKVATSIKTQSTNTPVIMLTGWGQRMMAANEIPPHVDKVLAKPPRLHELRARIDGAGRMTRGTRRDF